MVIFLLNNRLGKLCGIWQLDISDIDCSNYQNFSNNCD